MKMRPSLTSIRFALFVTAASVAAGSLALRAQAPAAAPASPEQRYAPIDLTGTWVSIVTEDWTKRMVTPPKGDFTNLPLTKAAQDAANRADMAAIQSSGRACDAYGAPVVMREPGRVRISWQDPTTLKIETDAGQQTRLLHFGTGLETSRGMPSRQGFSAAEWQYANGFDPERAAEAPAGGNRGGGGGRGAGAPAGGGGGNRGRGAPANTPQGGKLKVVTTTLAPGFLRKNGVPYSANTTVTEFYNLLTEPGGQKWFVVTTIIHDPENLLVDFITSTNFRQEPDASKWRPTPCTVR